MKILHITPWYAPAWASGGTAVAVTNFCEGLTKLACSVDVFTTLDSGLERPLSKYSHKKIINNVKVYYFRCGFFGTNFRGAACSIEMALSIIKNIHKYDLIHIHSTRNLYGIITMIACKLRKKPLILSPHASLMEFWIEKTGRSFLKKIYIYLVDKYVLKYSSKIHFLSDYEATCSKKYIFNKNFFVIPNGVTINKSIINSRKDNSFSLKLICVGIITPRKNFHLMIKALSFLKDKNIKLDIIGPLKDRGYYSYCKDIIEENKLTNISFLGSMKKDEIIDMYKSYDLFCMPSVVEGVSMALIEAASEGLPSLVSKGVGNYKEILEAKSGILVKENPKKIMEKILLINSNRSYLNFLKSNAYNFAKKNYCIKNITERLFNEYQFILNQSNK